MQAVDEGVEAAEERARGDAPLPLRRLVHQPLLVLKVACLESAEDLRALGAVVRIGAAMLYDI